MSEMLEFTTKTKTEVVEDGVVAPEGPPLFHCRLDGVDLIGSKPKDALVAQLAPVSSRRTPPGTKVKLALDFLGDCLLEPGRSYVETRLLDPADELDAEDVLPILQAMAEHWKKYTDERRAGGR